MAGVSFMPRFMVSSAATGSGAEWDSANKDADVTLSNGDRDATSAGWGSVRSKLGRSSGKYYWEVKMITAAPTLITAGLVLSTFTVTNNTPGQAGSSAGMQSGFNYVSGWTQVESGTVTFTTNDVVNFACDITNGYLWVGVNNVWSFTGGGTPAGGTGYWVSGISGTVYPAVGFDSSTSAKAQICAASSELNYSPPSGFTAWSGT